MTKCFSQQTDTLICADKNISFINAFIKGKRGKENIKWRFFYKEFKLDLSDPSFEIVQFCITWDDRRKNMLISRLNKGYIVKTEIESYMGSDKDSFSLENITPGILITFDRIVEKKRWNLLFDTIFFCV